MPKAYLSFEKPRDKTFESTLRVRILEAPLQGKELPYVFSRWTVICPSE